LKKITVLAIEHCTSSDRLQIWNERPR